VVASHILEAKGIMSAGQFRGPRWTRQRRMPATSLP
jgi:hypothetical protein